MLYRLTYFSATVVPLSATSSTILINAAPKKILKSGSIIRKSDAVAYLSYPCQIDDVFKYLEYSYA